jgi:anti-sigma B factor antagonist
MPARRVAAGFHHIEQEDHVQIDLQQASERVTVLAPKGRLDMSSAPAFRERVRQLIDAGTSQLVVDFGEVSFVDSSGLGAVIGGLKLSRQSGGDLRIARPNQQVLLVLDLTSLNRVLQPYASLEEALAGF